MTKGSYKPTKLQLLWDAQVGADVVIRDFVVLNECTIGDKTSIGPFVEIQSNATIGDMCKIASHTFICEGVTIEDGVFIGHAVVFVNASDVATADREMQPARVRRGASIGSSAVILPNVVIGERAMVGAGAVVTDDVPDGATVIGNPARVLVR